jgi:hypothetical protein
MGVFFKWTRIPRKSVRWNNEVLVEEDTQAPIQLIVLLQQREHICIEFFALLLRW